MTATQSTPLTQSNPLIPGDQRIPGNQWIPALAGYRALAALAVFAFHIISIDAPGGALGRWTVPLGNTAVSVFFVLSGFLIYRPFAAWALVDGPPVASWRFIIRRLARILPVYWVALTVHLFVVDASEASSLGDYLTVYTLVQNFRGVMVFLPPFVAWSLSIELWFSVALPAIAWAIRRVGARRSFEDRVRVQLSGIGMLAVAAVAFRIFALEAPQSGRLLWMPAYLDWFAAGLVLSVLVTSWRVRSPSPTVHQLAGHPWVLGSIGFGAFWAVTQLGLPGGFVSATTFQSHSQFLLEGLFSACLVTIAVLPRPALGSAGRFLSSRTLQWLGAVSYGIYLFHPIVTDRILVERPDLDRWVLALIAVPVTLAVSHIVHRLVEIPSSRFVDGLVSERRGDASPETIAVSPRPLPRRAPAPRRGSVVVRATTNGASEDAGDPWQMLGRGRVHVVLLALLSFASPLLSFSGNYVADSRFELTADPGARLRRMFTVWDGARDLGRPAEEFWPGITALYAAFHQLGFAPWVQQRLVHGCLLAIASIGAYALSRTLRPNHSWRALAAAMIYGFGPFSAVYLMPISIYVSYALAPWFVVAVLRGSRQRRPLAWAAATALMLFAAGNADPPGLVMALIPAAITAVAIFFHAREHRRSLIIFSVVAVVLTLASSAAMFVKTGAGAAALSHRLVETESTATIAATSSFTESIRGMGFWLTYFRLGPTPFRTHLALFIENGWIVILTMVPLAVGVAMLSVRVSAARLLALTWCVVGVVLMVGPHPITDPTPYGRALLELYERSDLAFAFRSTHKAGVTLAIGTALLGGWALADLAERASHRTGRMRTVPAVIVAGLIVALAAPFWSSPLYDPVQTTSEIPTYWDEAGQWLAAEDTGRVLVLPGTTNNGYRWGSVGDDLLDPLVPERVVASTLPLSTPFAADLIGSIDRYVTSEQYRPGTLRPLAARLGITHVLIRNDIAWEIQDVARPSALAALRADPDLEQVAVFGVPGLYVTSNVAPEPEEGTLPPVEIYRIADVQPPQTNVIEAGSGGGGRQVLTEGAGSAMLDLAQLGLLQGGRPVRFASQVDEAELLETGDDIALIVLSDSEVARDRRINFYGFEFSATNTPSEPNSWLPDIEPDDLAVERVADAQVGSTVDPWLLGSERRAELAIDGDPDTAWLIPGLVQSEPQRWFIEFDRPTRIGTMEITLQDAEKRVGTVGILADGNEVESRRSGDVVTAELVGRLSRLQVTFADHDPGLSPIGIAEMSFGPAAVPVVRMLPSSLAGFAAEPGVASELADVPIAVVLGQREPTTAPLHRDLELWRDDEFSARLLAETTALPSGCVSDVLLIDRVPVPVEFQAVNAGEAAVVPCDGFPRIALEAGRHRISFDLGQRFDLLAFETSTEPPLPIVGGARPSAEVGDLVVLDAAYDDRWRLASDPEAEPIMLDGLTAFEIETDVDDLGLQFGPDSSLDLAWLISIAGVAACLVLIGVSLRRPRWTQVAERSVATGEETMSASGAPTWIPPTRWGELQHMIGGLILFVMAVVVAGWAGGLAAIVAAAGSIRSRGRLGYLACGAALIVIAVVAAWPLIDGSRTLIDAGADDVVTRMVVGALIGLGTVSYTRLGSATSSDATAVSDGSLRSRSSMKRILGARERT